MLGSTGLKRGQLWVIFEQEIICEWDIMKPKNLSSVRVKHKSEERAALSFLPDL